MVAYGKAAWPPGEAARWRYNMSELQKSDYHAPKAKSSAFGYLNTHPHFWVPLSNRAVRILVDGAFSGSEYRVLLLLLSRANLERKEVSAASLAEALGVHVRTVERALNALAKKGVVKRGPFGWGVDPGLLATPGEDKTAGGAPGKTAAIDKRVIPSEEKALKEKKLSSSVFPSSPQNTRTPVHSKSSSSSPPRRRISTPGPKNPKDQKPGEPRVSSPRGERWAELRLALEQAGLWKECYQHLGRTGFLKATDRRLWLSLDGDDRWGAERGPGAHRLGSGAHDSPSGGLVPGGVGVLLDLEGGLGCL